MSDLPQYERDERPWGYFERFTNNAPSTVKILCVRAGEAFSLQTHEKRDEFWRVIGGTGVLTIGEQTHEVVVGDEFFIPKTVVHRAEGTAEDLYLLEIAFGEFDERDIVRLEDKYGRT